MLGDMVYTRNYGGGTRVDTRTNTGEYRVCLPHSDAGKWKCGDTWINCWHARILICRQECLRDHKKRPGQRNRSLTQSRGTWRNKKNSRKLCQRVSFRQKIVYHKSYQPLSCVILKETEASERLCAATFKKSYKGSW